MMQTAQQAEASRYLRQRPALLALARAFCENYRRLGHFGGTYRVEAAAEPEACRTLSAFLREDIRPGTRISWGKCLRAWAQTRFAAVPLGEACAGTSAEALTSRPAKRQARRVQREAILAALAEKYGDAPHCAQWLACLADDAPQHRLAKRDYALDEPLLMTVARALAALPEQYERLPFFANRVTGDPHALDETEAAGRVFLQALGWLAQAAPQGTPDGRASTAEEKMELLYRYHLLRDDVQNFATVYGIVPQGTGDTYFQRAAAAFAPLNLPLREIVRTAVFAPVAGSDIYIVENSGVFSSLLDALTAAQRCVPLLCLHGQPKLASWALLDRLAASGARLHYSGDYDPEGLAIAEKILRRYPDARPWHYEAADYAPRPSVRLTDARRKQLADITLPELQPAAAAIRDQGYAYYQESFADQLARDLLAHR